MQSPPERFLRARSLRSDAAGRFISDHRTRIALDDLRTGASLPVEEYRNKSVFLATSGQLPTVLAAMELDGVASRIVFCTPDQGQHIDTLMERAHTERVITETLVDEQLRHPVWPGERTVPTEWVLLTSGTTGMPKMAIHTLASLAGPLDDGLIGAVWSTFYDVRRYGGMQILLRALLGEGSMILSSHEEAPAAFLRRVGALGVTHISGTPSHWRRALMTEAATAMSPRYVRLSGEIVDQAILDRLHQTYPQANLGHAYATTEAGVGFDVRDGMAGFPASYIGDPRRSVELRVHGGTLHIRSSRTASSYVGAALNGTDGWIDTGDLVKLRNGRFYFAGRKEGVISVGGQKVYPEEVEAVITQHKAIQMARVWGRRSPITGSLVAADVVLHAESGLTLADVRDDLLAHCRQHLAAWKVPVKIAQVNSITLSPAGKIARA